MAITKRRLGMELKNMRNVAGSYSAQTSVLLVSLLLENLSPMEHKVLVVINNACGRNVTARDVAGSLDLEINNASNVLKALHEYDLLYRSAVITDEGLEYHYRPALFRGRMVSADNHWEYQITQPGNEVTP